MMKLFCYLRHNSVFHKTKIFPPPPNTSNNNNNTRSNFLCFSLFPIWVFHEISYIPLFSSLLILIVLLKHSFISLIFFHSYFSIFYRFLRLLLFLLLLHYCCHLLPLLLFLFLVSLPFSPPFSSFSFPFPLWLSSFLSFVFLS